MPMPRRSRYRKHAVRVASVACRVLLYFRLASCNAISFVTFSIVVVILLFRRYVSTYTPLRNRNARTYSTPPYVAQRIVVIPLPTCPYVGN